MSKKIFGCDFDIDSVVPPDVFEGFAAAQAKVTGVGGWIERKANGFKGQLEAEAPEVLDKMKRLLEKSEKFASSTKKAVFSEIKELKKTAIDNFQVKSKK